jgi:hypothetical protein
MDNGYGYFVATVLHAGRVRQNDRNDWIPDQVGNDRKAKSLSCLPFSKGDVNTLKLDL